MSSLHLPYKFAIVNIRNIWQENTRTHFMVDVFVSEESSCTQGLIMRFQQLCLGSEKQSSPPIPFFNCYLLPYKSK